MPEPQTPEGGPGRPSTPQVPAGSLRDSELPSELADFLALPGSHVLLIRGPAGTGKSTLSTELFEHLDGFLVLVTPPGESASRKMAELLARRPASQVLHVTTMERSDPSEASERLSRGHVLAAGPFGDESTAENPPWVEHVLRRLPPDLHSYIVVDHWTGGGSGGPRGADPRESPTGPEDRELQSLRVALEGTSTHLILIAEASNEDNPVSSVDGVVETGYDPTPAGRIRLLTLRKLRGVSISTTQYPYTLAEGRFRCATPLPPNFRPPIGPLTRRRRIGPDSSGRVPRSSPGSSGGSGSVP
jgi:hypothetical protein